MDARHEWTADQGGREAVREEAWLLGQPPLSDYLDFVERMTVGGTAIERSRLVDEWRAANDRYYELEETEGGTADQVEVSDLDPALERLADEVRSDARFRRAFDTLPTRFAMVELDRLVVSQPHVDIGHAERLKSRLGRSPAPDALFRFCLPLENAGAPVEMRRLGSRRFLFWSASSDFRFQEPALLGPEQIQGYDPFGPVGGSVGLMVGFGSNFLNVIQSDTRLLLHNGHHRAYALRDLGITHAPCLVQTVTRRDELNLVASRQVAESPAFYFKAARPPLLKDFFDPTIMKLLRTRPILRMVEVSFEAREFEVAG